MLKFRWSIVLVLAASLVAIASVHRTPDPGMIRASSAVAYTAPGTSPVLREKTQGERLTETHREREIGQSLRSAVDLRRSSLAAAPLELPGGGVILFPVVASWLYAVTPTPPCSAS